MLIFLLAVNSVSLLPLSHFPVGVPFNQGICGKLVEEERSSPLSLSQRQLASSGLAQGPTGA